MSINDPSRIKIMAVILILVVVIVVCLFVSLCENDECSVGVVLIFLVKPFQGN